VCTGIGLDFIQKRKIKGPAGKPDDLLHYTNLETIRFSCWTYLVPAWNLTLA
jgi:hypothetical protein